MIEHAWSDDSLRILQERLRVTSPVLPPACRNPDCGERLPRRDGGTLEAACGLCLRCYGRWWRAGQPESGVPPLVPPSERNAAARARLSAERAARVAEFARLRSRRYTIRAAALRMGIAVETAYTYSGEIKRQQREESEAA